MSFPRFRSPGRKLDAVIRPRCVWPLHVSRKSLFACVIALQSSGCSQTDLVAVQGSVQLDGVTLSAGSIDFQPVGGGPRASGEIESDGRFRLSTNAPNDGAKPGNYSVSVVTAFDPKLAGGATGNSTRRPDERLIFRSPRDRPIEVVLGKENTLTINIRKQDGWQMVVDD